MPDSEKSLLTREQMREWMKLVGEALNNRGGFGPTIFVQCDDGSSYHTEIHCLKCEEVLPRRGQMMKELSMELSESGRSVLSMVLIQQSWSIDVDKYPNGPEMPLENYPERHEAVTIIARNTDNSLCSAIEQLVVRTDTGKPKLGKVAREVYEQPPKQVGITSVLDDVFIFLDEHKHQDSRDS